MTRIARPTTKAERGEAYQKGKPNPRIRLLARSVEHFLAECCDLTDPTAAIPKDDVHHEYNLWAKERGHQGIAGRAQFARALYAAAPVVTPFRERRDGAVIWLFGHINWRY